MRQNHLLVTGISLGLLSALSLTVNASTPSPKTKPTSQTPPKVELLLVAYSTPKKVYDKVIPKFAALWKQYKGQEVVINAAYGGSGTQTQAVINGIQADIVALALGNDVIKLEKAGLVKPGWEKRAPNNAIVAKTVVALQTRQGNPKGIRTWNDLIRPDVKIITANPKTSGVAQWNFLALWSSVTQRGGSELKARDYVTKVYQNVLALAQNAREATNMFYQNPPQGDVLLNYENEIIIAAQEGKLSGTYIVPRVNISIDTPVAVVDKIVDQHKTRSVAEAFVKYLFTPEAQRIFAENGFRSVNPIVAKEFEQKYPKVANLYTVKNLGGWRTIQKKFFEDGAIFDQIYGYHPQKLK